MDRPLHCGLRPRALSRYRATAPVTGSLYIRRKFWLRCGLGSDICACACKWIGSRSAQARCRRSAQLRQPRSGDACREGVLCAGNATATLAGSPEPGVDAGVCVRSRSCARLRTSSRREHCLIYLGGSGNDVRQSGAVDSLDRSVERRPRTGRGDHPSQVCRPQDPCPASLGSAGRAGAFARVHLDQPRHAPKSFVGTRPRQIGRSK